MSKTAASHFMAYIPYDYCPRCRSGTCGVTRILCRPGRFRRSDCAEEPFHGEHLHCSCQICGREWIMACAPLPEHMVRI